MHGWSPDAPLTGGTAAQYLDYRRTAFSGEKTQRDKIVGHTYREHGYRMKEIVDFIGMHDAMAPTPSPQPFAKGEL